MVVSTHLVIFVIEIEGLLAILHSVAQMPMAGLLNVVHTCQPSCFLQDCLMLVLKYILQNGGEILHNL